MPTNETYKNVFDDKAEFDKLKGLLLGAVQDFTDYRQGNLTYGEILYVMECVLDSLRETSEKEALKSQFSKKYGERPSFTQLLATHSRLVETLLKKGALSSEEELYVFYGER